MKRLTRPRISLSLLSIAITLNCVLAMENEPVEPVIEPRVIAVAEPPMTEPPMTEPPLTEPPMTEPPMTEPPLTEPADIIIDYLLSKGFSKQVAAGILGNIMAEVGGGTLDISPSSYSSDGSFYGICQWSAYFYPDVQETSLEVQLDYLYATLPAEFDAFGDVFGCTYIDFLALSDPQAAALYFAKVYERCAEFSYGPRQANAAFAYEHYFGGDPHV